MAPETVTLISTVLTAVVAIAAIGASTWASVRNQRSSERMAKDRLAHEEWMTRHVRLVDERADLYVDVARMANDIQRKTSGAEPATTSIDVDMLHARSVAWASLEVNDLLLAVAEASRRWTAAAESFDGQMAVDQLTPGEIADLGGRIADYADAVHDAARALKDRLAAELQGRAEPPA